MSGRPGFKSEMTLSVTGDHPDDPVPLGRPRMLLSDCQPGNTFEYRSGETRAERTAKEVYGRVLADELHEWYNFEGATCCLWDILSELQRRSGLSLVETNRVLESQGSEPGRWIRIGLCPDQNADDSSHSATIYSARTPELLEHCARRSGFGSWAEVDARLRDAARPFVLELHPSDAPCTRCPSDLRAQYTALQQLHRKRTRDDERSERTRQRQRQCVD
jgi:hypothetical protein